MSIGSIGSAGNAYVSALQQSSAMSTVQAVGRERENDGDRDDGATVAKAPVPSVNLNGQLTGTTISITA